MAPKLSTTIFTEPQKAADTNATGGAQHQGEESQVVPMWDMIQRETDKSESDSPPAEIGKGVDATPKPFNSASYKKAVGGGDIVGSLRSRLASKEGVAIQQALDRMIAQPHAISVDFQRISDSILWVCKVFTLSSQSLRK
ncbi:hypothetical protein EDD17DRAFT_1763271 [Pisolithus thermaeus]|nr:hypothetical protein EDD17DRAFT_1763271 [Pisolithus thermaeus]